MARSRLYPPSVTPGIPRLGSKPEGWIETTFGEVLEVIQRPAKIQKDKLYQLVTAKRNRGGIVPREVLQGKKILTKTQFFIESGDFLISKRQIIHGACGIVPAELNGAIVSGEYSVLKATENLLLSYLAYLTHTIYFQQTCFQASVGVDVEKMIFDLDKWLQFKIYIPSVEEQCEVIKALHAWDKGILLIEELIAAKRRLRQALLSQLLAGPASVNQRATAKVEIDVEFGRIPSHWSIASLSEVADVRFSNVDKKVSADEIPARMCNYTTVYENDYLTQSTDFEQGSVTPNELDRFALSQGDVIITKDSETAADIAKPALVVGNLPGVVCGYHLAILRPNPVVLAGSYLLQAPQYGPVHRQLVRAANGITRYGLSLGATQNLKIPIPPLTEQEEIGATLLDFDREVSLLHQLHNRLRVQRKTLIHKLMAGPLGAK